MSSLKNDTRPDRGKIDVHDAREVQCWAKHLHVTKDELQQAVDKVGNGAAAVRKQLAVGLIETPGKFSKPTEA